jgi:hypothetical protein
MSTTKSTRLSAEEVAFLHKLLPHFPEYRSESHFLHDATMLGLWVLAVAARRPALAPFGGYDPADLAALLQPRILAALDFLAEQGYLPTLVRISQTLAAKTQEDAEPSALGATEDLAPSAAADMADLGTEFMDE